jgi:ribosome biogenesis GTPase
MSKRKISHQQAERIKKKQQSHHTTPVDSPHPSAVEGLVITRFGRRVEIEDAQGARIHCAIRPHIESLVAGDKVLWQPSGPDLGVIISQYPRESVLARADSHGRLKPIAANITQICIVIAPEPKLSWVLLDSYLVMAETLNVRACIILNKVDLASQTLQKQLETTYLPLDYPVLFTGLNHPTGDVILAEQMKHQTNIFVGQSGVGKSSLIKRLLPHEAQIQTGELSTRTNLGCHTTSSTSLYHIPSGGALIDSPGVREFDLTHLSIPHIAQGFHEFKPYIDQCKFRNCDHESTPGCAVHQAVNNGFISPHRYKNYVRISTQFSK